jgi:hypothetical protein
MQVRNPEKDKLRIIVKDWDRFTKSDPLGEADIYLSRLPMGVETVQWYPLVRRGKFRGEIQVGVLPIGFGVLPTTTTTTVITSATPQAAVVTPVITPPPSGVQVLPTSPPMSNAYPSSYQLYTTPGPQPTPQPYPPSYPPQGPGSGYPPPYPQPPQNQPVRYA